MLTNGHECGYLWKTHWFLGQMRCPPAEPRYQEKRNSEEKRLRGTLEDLQTSIQRRLDNLERDAFPQLRLFNTEEEAQFRADIRALGKRVQRIGDDIDKEIEILHRRYEVRDVNCFPVAAELLVPLKER